MRHVLPISACLLLLAGADQAAAQRCSGPSCGSSTITVTGPGWYPTQYAGWECFWNGKQYTHWLNSRTGEMQSYGQAAPPAPPEGSRSFPPYLDPRPARETPPAGNYTGWAQSMYYPGWFYWWWNGAHRFAFQPDRNEFCAWDGDRKAWSQPRPWPYEIRPELPGYRQAAPRLNFGVDVDRLREPAMQNFGVDVDQLRGGGPTLPQPPDYRINGQFVTRDQAAAALAGGAGPGGNPNLPDDSGKRWLVVCSKDKATRERIAQDLENSPALAEMRARVKLQVYEDPNHWQLAGYKLEKDARFQRSGIGCFVVDPPGPGQHFGEAVAACYSYDGPEALRRIDPGFDPNKVPDGNSSGMPLLDQVLKLLGLRQQLNAGVIILGIAGVVGVVYLIRRKNSQQSQQPAQQLQPSYSVAMTERQYREREPAHRPPPEPLSLGELAMMEQARRRRERELAELQAKRDAEQDAAIRELFAAIQKKPEAEKSDPAKV